MLFQIVDDILDVTGSQEALGKPQGSDERLGKRTYVTEFGLDGARKLAGESHDRARAALAQARPGRRGRARADHRLHRDPNLLMTEFLQRIDKPQDLHGLNDEELQVVAAGGPRAHHRHRRRDRRPLRRQPRNLRDRRRAALAARLPARQDPLGRRPSGLSAQGPHRPPRSAAHDPQVRGPGAVLLDPRVRARHHGRRPRLDRDRLCRRDQGGDARRPRRGRPRRRGRRRRRDDRRRRVRGRPPGRRRGHADRRRAQRQRDVDRAERRARSLATSTASA